MATRTWWVGHVRPGANVQHHTYLVEAGVASVLLDPPAAVGVRDVLRKVTEVVPVSHVRTVVVHGADARVGDGLRVLADELDDDVRIVTDSRSADLLADLGVRLPLIPSQRLGNHLDLGGGRGLELAPLPGIHGVVSLTTFDAATGALFSGDLFAARRAASSLWLIDDAGIDAVVAHHREHGASREALMAALASVRARFAPIRRILPRQGQLAAEDRVEALVAAVFGVECRTGLDAEQTGRLLELARTVRRIDAVVDRESALPLLVRQVERELASVLPVRSVAVEVDLPGEGVVRFAGDLGEAGLTVDHWTPPGGDTVVVPMTSPGQSAMHLVVRLTDVLAIDPAAAELLLMAARSARAGVLGAVSRRDRRRPQRPRHAEPHDELTGLTDRWVVEEAYRPAGDLAVLLVDIDHLTSVNERHGRDAGDEVLRRVADTVARAVRHTDTVVRYGEEELLVLSALDGPNAFEVDAIAERIRRTVSALTFDDVAPGRIVTVSVGAAIVADDESVVEAVARADRALARAKDAGRNRVELAA